MPVVAAAVAEVVEVAEAAEAAAAVEVAEEEEMAAATGEEVVDLPLDAPTTAFSSPVWIVLFVNIVNIDIVYCLINLSDYWCTEFWNYLNCSIFWTGLPPTGSWQDLKDHMREAGDVCYADTYKDGTGMVEFLRYEDMKYAIKKLDDSRFRSHEVFFLFKSS